LKLNFGIERERDNRLYYKEVENDDGEIHFHSQIEICIVEEGEMDILSGGKRKILKGDEMCISLSYDPHVYKPIDYSKSIVMVIPLYMCTDFISVIKDKKIINPFICDKEVVRKIKKCFYEIKSTENTIIRNGYVNVLLGIIMENISFEEVDRTAIENELLSEILFYIHENFQRNITLSEISAKFGYHQSYISRYFKAYFNVGINQYIRVTRLKNFIILMKEGRGNIACCALESGFNSLRTFNRVFYKEFKCSPKEYLKKEM